MEIFFWIACFIIFYTYIGYGLILFLLVKTMRREKQKTSSNQSLPSLTVVVAAYNEADIIRQKLTNTISLEYPPELKQVIVVTDGSTDETPLIVKQFTGLRLMHNNERRGKINAIHRVMQEVTTDIVVFTDANTFLNQDALLLLASHYQDPNTGAVAGEKRVAVEGAGDAASTEGVYWKYESQLKKWDAELYTVVGAAGELFSMRTALYSPVPADTILDDFQISLQVVQQGFRVAYEPNAIAREEASADVKEELKRKIRIAAGGIQAVIRLWSLLNPLRYPLVSFQYISHRVLRWTLTPLLLPVVLLLNIILITAGNATVYKIILIMQVLFYSAALSGYLIEKRGGKVKALFVPYYFCLMNYAVFAGMKRYLTGKQSAIWEKSRRKETV
ncbi:MAG: glycosyltransferase family 2 protein [Candidatus Dadabacteria bacterium]